MYLRTLGELSLEPRRFRRPKPLLLLAYLALEGPRSRRQLAELLWLDARDPRDSLSTTVRRLGRGAGGLLSTRAGRLATDVPCDAVELTNAAQADRPERVVALYAGPFLDGLDLPLQEEIEEWVYATRERLANHVRRARLSLARAALRAGDAPAVAAHAEGALDVQHATWSHGDAEEVRHLLHSCDSPRAREVEREARQWGIILGASHEDALGDATHRTNLPRVATSFVGREAELLRVREVAAQPHGRLLNLHGPGGVGKSRLAIEAARALLEDGSCPDGAFFVPLGTVEDGDGVAAAIAASMDLDLAPGGDPDEQLAARIGHRRILLVLDNFEHLVQRSALPATLVRACPNLRLVVTSRTTLNVDEEHVIPVEGLPTAGPGTDGEAIRLLEDRIGQRDPDGLRQPEQRAPRRRICRLLEGNPLAIELAAALTRVLSPPEIAAQLETGVDLLVSRDPTASLRHRSMKAALDVSWNLLGAADQEALARLAVFQGGFTRRAAAVVADVDTPTLSRLVDAALVRPLPSGRFQRHPLIHQYTERRLAQRAETEAAVNQRHARYFLRGLAARDHDLHGGETSAGVLSWIDAEFANLQRAWGSTIGRHQLGLLADATWALAHYAEMRGRYGDVIPMLERAAAAIGEARDPGSAPGSYDEALGNVLGCLAFLEFRIGRIETSMATAERSLELLEPMLRPSGNWGWWAARQALGMACVFLSEHERAGVHLRIGVERGEQDRANAGGDARLERMADYCIGVSYEALAYIAMHEGRFEEAQQVLRRAQRRFEPHRAPALGYVYWNLGQVHLAMGALEAAHEALSEGLHFSRATGFEAHVGQILNELVRVHVRRGDLERAETTAREALELADRTGDKWLETSVLAAYGLSAAASGRSDEARSRYLASVRAGRESKGYAFAMEALLGLTDLWASDGTLAESVELLAFIRGSALAPTAVARQAEERLAQLEGQLDAEGYRRALHRGEAMDAREAYERPDGLARALPLDGVRDR